MFSMNSMRDNTNDYLREQTKAHALELNSVIVRIETAVAGIEKSVIGQFDKEKLEDPEYYKEVSNQLHRLADQYVVNDFNGMSIYVRFDPELSYGTAGIFYADTDADGKLEKLEPTDLSMFDAADRERVAWFYEPFEAGKSLWLKPYFNANINVEMVSYVKPLVVDGRPIGVVGADINFDQLRSITEKQIEAGKIIIIDQDQSFLVHDQYGITERMDTIDDGRLLDVYKAIESKESGLMRYVLEGEEKVLGYSRLMNEWTVIVALSLQDAFTELNRSIATFMSVVGTISVVMVVSSLYLGNYINKVMTSNVVLQRLVDDRTEQLNDTNTYLQNSLAEIQTREAELTMLNSQLEDTLEEMNRLQDQMIRTEKLQSLGSIVNGLSHEINTPLGLIITTNSFLSGLIASLKSNEANSMISSELNDIDEGIEIIEKASMKLRRLVKSFKMLTTEASHQDIRQFDLIRLLKVVESNLHESLETMGHRVMIIGDQSAAIVSYPEVIEYVIKQLISNSVLHGANDQDALVIQIQVQVKGNDFVIHFKDNGLGIDDNALEKVFDPFYSTAKNKGNVGLGLHIVHNLVTQVLKGQMEVIKDLDAGFGLTLTLHSHKEV